MKSPGRKVGLSPLLEAVHNNDVASLRNALGSGADPNERDRDGATPLMYASVHNRPEIAKVLLCSGADVNAQDSRGYSALHIAAQEYHTALAHLLIEHGAAIEIEDVYGNTPLFRAVFNSKGRGEMIACLLAAGADRHHCNKHGRSPLELANTIANYPIAQFFA